MRHALLVSALLTATVYAGCSSQPGPQPDGGAPDSGVDGGLPDSGVPDGGPVVSASPFDAGPFTLEPVCNAENWCYSYPFPHGLPINALAADGTQAIWSLSQPYVGFLKGAFMHHQDYWALGPKPPGGTYWVLEPVDAPGLSGQLWALGTDGFGNALIDFWTAGSGVRRPPPFRMSSTSRVGRSIRIRRSSTALSVPGATSSSSPWTPAPGSAPSSMPVMEPSGAPAGTTSGGSARMWSTSMVPPGVRYPRPRWPAVNRSSPSLDPPPMMSGSAEATPIRLASSGTGTAAR